MLIIEQLAKIMADVEAIGKDRKNQQQGYNFRGIDDMYNDLHKHFAKHKVIPVPSVISSQKEERTNKNGTLLIYTTLQMKFTFYATDGSSVEAITEGEAMDSGDKSSNKAMSSAYKYALIQVLMIPTEEEKDTEAQSPQPLPKPHPQAEMITDEQRAKIEEWLSVDSIPMEIKASTKEWLKKPQTKVAAEKVLSNLSEKANGK